MKSKDFPCLLVIFSIWTSIFAPFVNAQNSEAKGLQFRIRESSAKPAKESAKPPIKIESLSEREANAIFRRLPPMPSETSEDNDFKMRSDSLKPPKTGKIIPLKFSADENQKPPDVSQTTNEKLQVERFSPSGNVPIVSDLSVTFSQPMVAVSSQTNASETVPVVLTPEVRGNWRWLGANTLIFDAEKRFPMATRFTAKISKGTKSAIGGVLEKDISWTFTTPPPKVEKFSPEDKPEGILPEYVIMAAKFNQEIDEKEILPKIKVFADGKQVPIKSVTDDIDNSFEEIKSLGEVKPKTWLAFRTVDLLPKNADVKVVFEKDLPSAEGMLTSETDQNFKFKTLTPFKFVNSYCGYNENKIDCDPSDDLHLEFNRPFSQEKFDKSLVKIEPAIENAIIETVGSNEIQIRGEKKPNTVYKVAVSGKAADLHKQTLSKDVAATFKVGKSQPIFNGDGDEFLTLDPNGKLRYSIYSRNHKSFNVKVYSVTPDDYVRYRKVLRDFTNNKQIVPKIDFGKLIIDKIFKIKNAVDIYEETIIDLQKVLPNRFGHAVLVAEPTDKIVGDHYWDKPFIIWIQSTNIGVDAFLDYEKLVAFATDLKTAKPLSNAEISLHNDFSSVLNSVTDSTGIAEFQLTDAVGRGFLVVKTGEDSAILREEDDYSDRITDWRKQKPKDTLRWFVFDDRKIYRPEEQVSIKGYIRKVTGGKFTDIAEISDNVKSVRYVLKDALDNEIGKGNVKLNTFGAFDFKLDLQKNINLGYQSLEFWTGENKSEHADFEHTFQVQEFRRPEYEVSTKVETAAPFFVGESADVSTEAKYYSGGFLKNANTVWNVTSVPTNYTPPNRDDFTFGKYVPWWRYSGSDYDQRTSKTLSGKTDADGKHRITLDFDEANPARPYTIQTEANVQDVNRQSFAAAANLLVHPSTIYVGIRSPRNFVSPNEKLKIETITTDIDGKAVADKTVSIVAELHDYKYVEDEWTKVLIDKQTCEIRSTEDVASCEILAKQGGTFTIKATVLDDRERRNESELDVWVAGGSSENSDQIKEEDAELIPDKKEYFAGDTAKILVNSPFFPAEGVLTLERNGILKTERFTMSENSKILQIPIEENYLPNVHVKIDLVGTTPRKVYEDERDAKLPKRPAFASGELNLSISTETRKLNVTAETIVKTLEPGGETKINVDVKDFSGNAVVNSEVAIVAVDEGVLALTNYKITNPIETFYTEINANVANYHSRENILLSHPDDAGRGNGVGYGSGNGGGGGGGRESDTVFRRLEMSTSLNRPPSVKYDSPDQIKIRRNFDALAIFSPTVVTDENGKATVDLKLPDNLTRYRLTAVAVTKSKQFGKSESNFTAKTSLQIRPSAPRFMNFGDVAELPVVLQNQTDSPMTVNVAIRSNNANLPNGNGRKVTIPANDRVEIRFPVSTEKAGIARFQVGATSGKFADAAEFAFPVYTPTTSEAFATYGTTEANGAIVQSISAPQNVYSQFGGLEITTSSTQLQELTDAFIYLQSYPFECTEQISSRVLSVAALRDVLQAFEAKDLPTKIEIEVKMKADIERLQTLQHSDGGFSFWRSDDASIPYISVHVAHAFARAKAKGYEVPNQMIAKSLDYLKNIEAKYPQEYSEKSRWAISAYALYVRDLLGENDAAKAKKLLNEVGLEKLSLETDGWLLSVLTNDKNSANEVETIKRHLLNRVTETAGNAHFVTNYSDGEYVLLSSERRADGVILEALLRVQSSEFSVQSSSGVESLIPKIVRGLLANRTKGRWGNTQENAFILLALDKYFQVYEKATPDFVAKVWLGKAFAGEQKFVGRSTDSNLLNVPMSYLQSQTEPKQNLVLDKQGEGRLYYRIGLKYAPKNLNMKSADYGFEVSRTYEALDDADDVRQNADGSWTFKAGSRIRINVQMVAPTRRYHVALVDNLPAGIEIINSSLANSSRTYLTYSDELRRRSFWFNHQNLRDNRAEAFTTYLREGVWNYSYPARAIMPGNFVVPPAKAEEMYSPETFGRSRTDFVNVE